MIGHSWWNARREICTHCFQVQYVFQPSTEESAPETRVNMLRRQNFAWIIYVQTLKPWRHKAESDENMRASECFMKICQITSLSVDVWWHVLTRVGVPISVLRTGNRLKCSPKCGTFPAFSSGAGFFFFESAVELWHVTSSSGTEREKKGFCFSCFRLIHSNFVSH